MKRLVGIALGFIVLLVLSAVVIAGGGMVDPGLQRGECRVRDTPPPSAAPAPTTTSRPGTSPTPSRGIEALPASGTGVNLNAEQMAAARAVAGVGKGMSIAPRGIAIALATAMQESTLNPNAVNGRSLGLFQQQGQYYAHIDRRNPAAAAGAFYEMLLKRVPDYADPRVGFADAAQEVQRSGAGARWYARWESWATTLTSSLLSGYVPVDDDGNDGEPGGEPPVECEPQQPDDTSDINRFGTAVDLPEKSGFRGRVVFPNELTATVGQAALSHLGVPYAWGGGNSRGATRGISDGGGAGDRHGDTRKTGFDCSGLMEYSFAQAGISIGGDSRTQRARAWWVIPYSNALPGDLLFWGAGGIGSIHHVALYLGEVNGQHLMVESPQSGLTVRVAPVRTGGDFRAREAGRFVAVGVAT